MKVLVIIPPREIFNDGAIYLINPSSIRSENINNFTKVVKYQMSSNT